MELIEPTLRHLFLKRVFCLLKVGIAYLSEGVMKHYSEEYHE